jgi:protein-serine/threonine kinase
VLLPSMEPKYLNPLVGGLSAPSGPKLRQINDAKEMQGIIADRSKRLGRDPPPYEFLELIGKGTYGRVYKRFVPILR